MYMNNYVCKILHACLTKATCTVYLMVWMFVFLRNVPYVRCVYVLHGLDNC